MKYDADYWIKKLNLQEHIEGGYFNEIYRASETISEKCLPERFESPHCFSTSIYFLLKSGQVSRFHRLKTDEIWHYYTGSPAIIYTINESGEFAQQYLGPDIEKNQHFQVVIPANTWFAAHPIMENSYVLVGCTVAPGFEYENFELADSIELLSKCPQYQSIILMHT